MKIVVMQQNNKLLTFNTKKKKDKKTLNKIVGAVNTQINLLNTNLDDKVDEDIHFMKKSDEKRLSISDVRAEIK